MAPAPISEIRGAVLMAIYRLSANVVKRSAGRSAVATAAYRAGERIDDERTGQNFDYTRKGGVLHTEILAPDNAPDWMLDRSKLWNAVEIAEKRKDAQLAREVQLALPHELTPEQRLDLVRGFVREQFVDRGMIADIAIHMPDRDGDQRNFHAHVMLTMRAITGDGFGNKCREWNADFARGKGEGGFVREAPQLEQWREHWAQHVNQAMERAGHPERVDHRSYEDQGIDLEPEPKIGPHAAEMERRGSASDKGDELRAVRARNAARRPANDQNGPRAAIVATSNGGMVAQEREALRLSAMRKEAMRRLNRLKEEGHKGADQTKSPDRGPSR